MKHVIKCVITVFIKARQNECVCVPWGEFSGRFSYNWMRTKTPAWKEGLESVSAWSSYLLQDCLNMANSNGFVLGEECSRVQLKWKSGHFHWHGPWGLGQNGRAALWGSHVIRNKTIRISTKEQWMKTNRSVESALFESGPTHAGTWLSLTELSFRKSLVMGFLKMYDKLIFYLL